jgi:hypothetical protein
VSDINLLPLLSATLEHVESCTSRTAHLRVVNRLPLLSVIYISPRILLENISALLSVL